METRAWHALEAEAVLRELDAGPRGLTDEEARRRIERDGPNRITKRRGKSALRKLAAQFTEPLVVVLIAAALVSIALDDVVDAIVIGAVVLVNGLIGFVQERRAEQAIEGLDRLVVTEATVLRDGAKRRVPSEELVRGDLVLLQSGDTVPADLRLLELRDLQCEEAPLTGESVPSSKSLEPLPADTFVGDRKNLAFAGMSVTYGQGKGVVVAVGDATETGRIADMLSKATSLETPLTQRIAALSRLLVWSILGAAALLFGLEALRGASLVDTFNAAVALAVGAIPEGLPAAVTILLAVGVSSMAKRRAIVRRLPAVETLGSTTVICSDKTGTLTENQMTVTTLLVAGERYELSGEGYAPEGELLREGARFDAAGAPSVEECLRAGALCNDTRIAREGGEVKVEGDPTEAALLVGAEKLGLVGAALEAWPRLDVVPFESEHMYMATLHARAGDQPVLYVKGSSDALLARCVDQLDRAGQLVPLDHDALHAEVERLAADGLRVLLVARRTLEAGRAHIGHDDVTGLSLLGLVGMIDPPRAAAKQAVADCRGAGIAVKMITGDHAVTASAIAAEIGLEGERTQAGRLRAVTGKELGEIADEALPEIAERVAVFARVAPEQKLRLVRALQARGHVVAMTGDGVNDAPALKQADIGVAMGRGGTDVARSAAAMVLTDDDFATIAAAVEEGRGVYDNLVKFIAWTLPTNGGEALVLLLAVLFGAQLPVLPVQLLWVNMATAVLLGIALVFEPKEPGLMGRKPRPVAAPILSASILWRIVLVSSLIALAAFGLFELASSQGESIEVARTVAVNTVVVAEVGYLFACRSLSLPIWKLGLFSNRWVWVGAFVMLAAQLAITYVPLMNRLFHTAPLPLVWWGAFTAVGGVVFALVELKKLVGRRAR